MPNLNSVVKLGRVMKSSRHQQGFLQLPNDNMFKTIAVAVALCLVCSVVVSTAATLLKPKQVANKLLDKKQNIIAVAGLGDSGQTVDEAFSRIDTRVVELSTGEYSDAVDSLTYDQRKASKDPQLSIDLDKKQDIAGIGRRANLANVYLLQEDNQVQKIILPIKGYGLWSQMYGFVALEADANTVSGITFYEHGETPGLGGEIENARWQKSWVGKKISDDADASGEPILRLVKGSVDTSLPESEYKIDGLAGATLTSNGVSNLIKFWLGQDGFGPYLQRIRQGILSAESASNVELESNGLSQKSPSADPRRSGEQIVAQAISSRG